MTWILIGCISFGRICNVYIHFEYFDQQDCIAALEQKARENPHWTHIGCVPYDEAAALIKNQ